MIILSVFVCLFGILYWTKKAKGLNEPPMFHRSLPLIGHTYTFLRNAKSVVEVCLFGFTKTCEITIENLKACRIPSSMEEFRYTHLKALYKILEECGQYSQDIGGVMRILVAGRTYYFLTDPEDTTTLALKCLEKQDHYDFFRPWFGESLIMTNNVDKWKRNRKLLNPAFNQHVLDEFYEAFNRQAKKLVDDLETVEGKGYFDHTSALKLYALETICLTVLGIDFSDHTILNKRYIEASREVFLIVLKRIQYLLLNNWIFSLTPLKKRQDKCIEILNNMTDTVLKKRKLQMKNDEVSENVRQKNLGTKFKPFMDLLLEMDSMNDQEIRDELNMMIYASHDTTAITLVFALHVIGSRPDIQRKLHEEVDAILGDYTECVINRSNIRELVYLEAVVEETLRLYPVTPIVLRNVDKDVVLKNYTLSKDSYACLYLTRLNRHPMWGKDAEEFRPERWLEPGGVPDHPSAFASFSVGRRNCIGKAYALMSMKVTLAHVIRHFKITSDNSKLELKLDLMLKPASGHEIAIERRTKQT